MIILPKKQFKVPFNVEYLEKTVSGYDYQQRLTRTEKVEASKLPLFSEYFYNLLERKKDIFSPDEFVSSYTNFYNLTQDINAIKGRAYRAYPSLLRDLHLYMLCSESPYFQNVIYNLEEDINNNVDLSLTYKDKRYDIAIFLQSINAEYHYDRKSQKNKNVIELRYDLSNNKSCGNIHLWNGIDMLIFKLECQIQKENLK